MASVWPHRLRPKVGVAIAIGGAVARATSLSVAAYFDKSLWLPGEAVGLFKHSGILAVVLGDAILFLLCVYAGRMTRSIGRRLPTDRRRLAQRYFRMVILRRILDGSGSFHN